MACEFASIRVAMYMLGMGHLLPLVGGPYLPAPQWLVGERKKRSFMV